MGVVGGGVCLVVSFRELAAIDMGVETGIALLLFCAVAAVVYHLVRWLPFAGWQKWPTVTGSVESCGVRRTGKGRLYIVEVGYTYHFEGELYSGHYSRKFQQEDAAETYARDLRESHPRVRVKPRSPEVSRVIA